MTLLPRVFLSGLFLLGGLSALAFSGLLLGESRGESSFAGWMRCVEEGRRIETLDRAVQRCSTSKIAVTTDLVAGRLTLTEAARQFRLLEESAAEAGVPDSFWENHDEYDRLLSWVESHMPYVPGDPAEVRARLTNQWRQHFGTARDLPPFLAGTGECVG